MTHHNQDRIRPGCAGTCCLRLEDVGLKVGSLEILSRVSFHLHCGEMVALIGPNGAGKTSLFRTILGQMPYTGKIVFAPAGASPTRPLIGYVPQSPAFQRGDPVSVLDVFAAAVSNWPVALPVPGRLRARIAACLERTGTSHLADQRIGALSGGELQRVLLAMALEPLPHILMMDEPLSGVDIEGVEQLMRMLDEIRRTYDLSILFSTHDFSALRRYADRVLLLDRRLLMDGAPEQVLTSPAFRGAFHLAAEGGQ